MTALSTADVLRRAARTLETNGWCQGLLVAHVQGTPLARCRMDVVGAIRFNGEILRPTTITDDAEDTLMDVLGLSPSLTDGCTAPLFWWNDEPGRTVGEVLEALESAAVLAEQGGAS